MKKILFIAALALCFVACENETPFDTQDPNDAPLILKPYNESGTGSFTYQLANPDTPLHDSVTVTPSAYTTVNWYLDKQLVFTGTKINMTFPAGKYALTIEAVTTAGKRTERTGSVTVNPYATDPYVAAPSGGLHAVANSALTLSGQNLAKVAKVLLTSDIFAENEIASIEPTEKSDGQLTCLLPQMEDGTFYLRFLDEEGNIYGSEQISIHNGAAALAGFNSFDPGKTWVITGLSLQDVVSVTVDETIITELVATESSVTLTAPEVELGDHTVSMQNADGSAVLFITANGAVTQITVTISEEKTLWEGAVTIDWNADLLRVEPSKMADIPVGANIYVYFDVPSAEYYSMRITIPDWGDDYLAQVDEMHKQPNPYSFEFDAHCKSLVEANQPFCVVGFGITVKKITYK